MELACRFEDQTWSNEKKYTCVVNSASITEPNTIVAAIRGTHLPNRTEFDVEAIKFEDTTVHYFPRGLRHIFRHLNAIQINKCELREISSEDLSGLESLTTLFLGYNQLTSLPSNLFVNMHKLKSISFYNNKLEFMSSDILAPIVRNPLHYVNFRRNKNLDGLYDPPNTYSVRFVEDLMDLIEESCSRPIIEEKTEQKRASNEKFMDGFKELWATGRLSDFTIIAESRAFKVHKSVLSVRSSVFAAVFENDMQERQNSQMTIHDFCSGAVEDFLYFLYTGEVASEEHAMDLFALASKYDIAELKAASEKAIIRNLDDTNALEILVLGNLHRSDDIRQKAFHEIKLKHPEINFIDDLLTKPDHLKQIIEAKIVRDRKIQEANREYEDVLEILNSKP